VSDIRSNASEESLRQHVVLARFGELALRSSDLDEILTESCRLVGEALGTDLAKVVELQPDGETLLVRAGVGWKPGVVGIATIQKSDRTSEGMALETGKPMISPDIATETRFEYPAFLLDHGVKAVANVPIIGGEGRPPYGILQVDSREPRAFTENDTAFLSGYANLLAATVDRFRVIHEMRGEDAKVREELEAKVADRTTALAGSNAQLDAFAYTVSHDLRAPLRAMEGFARILLDDFGSGLGDKGARYAGRIVAAAGRMERLINDLLAYSQLQRLNAKLRVVDPMPLVMRACAATKSDYPDATVDVQAPLLPVLAEPVVLGQALSNLIGNAAKFHKPNIPASIVVRSERRDDRIRLWVEDQGIGIAPDHYQRIFEVFERLHGEEAFPGTGIGLAIVEKGAELMGGRCGVESRLGEGSRFWIDLDSADGTAERMEQQAKAAASG
jgi:signal transduction histidine kinase